MAGGVGTEPPPWPGYFGLHEVAVVEEKTVNVNIHW